MPKIAKIVCGTHGGVGAGGAITPGVIYTLIPGSPNAEFSFEMDYHQPKSLFTMSQDEKLMIPENDAALCNMLSAASELEPGGEKNEIYLYYSEITLDDGTVYHVPYSQLKVLISALWRSCSERGFSTKPVSEPAPVRPAPQPTAGSWNCPTCGFTGLTGKFCTECGSPKPADGFECIIHNA